MQVSAQISLYPLRQESLSPTIEAAWKILEDSQLGLFLYTLHIAGLADLLRQKQSPPIPVYPQMTSYPTGWVGYRIGSPSGLSVPTLPQS